MKTVAIIFGLIILNYVLGVLYLATKDHIYAFLLKKGTLKSSRGPSFLDLLILQVVFPVQFFDMIFNGYGVMCYVNPLVWSQPALPFAPNWMPNDTFRRVLAHIELFTAKNPQSIIEKCAKELKNFEHQEQVAWNQYLQLRRMTKWFGLLSVMIHGALVILWLVMDIVVICTVLFIALVGITILAWRNMQKEIILP